MLWQVFSVQMANSRRFMHKQDWISLLNKSVLEFSGKLIGYTVATFFIGCIAYGAYLMLLKLMKMCKNIFIKCEDV